MHLQFASFNMMKLPIFVATVLALQSVVRAQSQPVATASTVVGVFASSNSYGILLEAVKAAGLYDTITGASFTGTLLAPNDPAFASLLGILNVSKSEVLGNKALLTTVLTYHVLPTTILRVEDFAKAGTIATLLANHSIVPISGSTLGLKGERSSANFSGISGLVGMGSDIKATVFGIDAVLLPTMPSSPGPANTSSPSPSPKASPSPSPAAANATMAPATNTTMAGKPPPAAVNTTVVAKTDNSSVAVATKTNSGVANSMGLVAQIVCAVAVLAAAL